MLPPPPAPQPPGWRSTGFTVLVWGGQASRPPSTPPEPPAPEAPASPPAREDDWAHYRHWAVPLATGAATALVLLAVLLCVLLIMRQRRHSRQIADAVVSATVAAKHDEELAQVRAAVICM